MNAAQLRDQTDRMIADYEKLKADLTYTVERNQDLTGQLDTNVQARRRAEDDLLRIQKDFEEYKVNSNDQQNGLQREVAALTSQSNELRERVDKADSDNRQNLEQLGSAHRETLQWRDLAERLQSENRDAQSAIEDLEMKNRLLVDKLNN